MFRRKNTVLGKVIASNKIQLKSCDQGKFIPGQKVIIYKDTGRKIKSASGRVLGNKETVLGTGRVQIDGDKTIIKTHSDLDTWSVKESNGCVLSPGSKERNTYPIPDVCIKPIDE